MKKCFVAVSGGVDSAVALLLLKNQGFETEGITMKPFGKELVPSANSSEAEDAKKLCESLSVPHHFIDLSEEFKKTVIADFISAYQSGETPNPCVVCNRFLKFGALADYAFDHGADFYATGHYVQIKQIGNKKVISRAKDPEKDQSYVLWRLTADQVAKFVAPLGEFSKKEVRDIAKQFGFSVADKSDSQDICFIPDGDYRAFLDRLVPNTDKSGDFILGGKKIGVHNGQRCYTIGQRKGLGIAYTEPLYVIGRNIAENQVILGRNSELFKNTFTFRNANFSGCDYPAGDFNCDVKIRYRAKDVKCRLIPLDHDRFTIETEEPVRAVTPGQSAVFYDGDILLGGGIIE